MPANADHPAAVPLTLGGGLQLPQLPLLGHCGAALLPAGLGDGAGTTKLKYKLRYQAGTAGLPRSKNQPLK